AADDAIVSGAGDRHAFKIVGIADAGDILAAADIPGEAFERAPVGAAVHQRAMEAEFERNALAVILPVEGGAKGVVGPVFEDRVDILLLYPVGVSHEEIVVHRDHASPARAFGDERQGEARDAAPAFGP